ncbi:hypothetical protein C8R46DRAFT_1030699 [Mycena filopes]|nr:hypothetical protein C8R46DRAFT_1030699 [Mycena filopes]
MPYGWSGCAVRLSAPAFTRLVSRYPTMRAVEEHALPEEATSIDFLEEIDTDGVALGTWSRGCEIPDAPNPLRRRREAIAITNLIQELGEVRSVAGGHHLMGHRLRPWVGRVEVGIMLPTRENVMALTLAGSGSASLMALHTVSGWMKLRSLPGVAPSMSIIKRGGAALFEGGRGVRGWGFGVDRAWAAVALAYEGRCGAMVAELGGGGDGSSGDMAAVVAQLVGGGRNAGRCCHSGAQVDISQPRSGRWRGRLLGGGASPFGWRLIGPGDRETSGVVCPPARVARAPGVGRTSTQDAAHSSFAVFWSWEFSEIVVVQIKNRLFGAGEARHVVVPRAQTQTRNAEQKIISERDVEENRITVFEEILAKPRENHLALGQLMLATARQEVGPWAEDYVAGRVHAEAQAVTASKILQTQGVRVDNDYVTGFRMTEVGARIASFARVTTGLLNAFATSARNLKTNLPHRAAKRLTVVTSAALALLSEFSHKNNYSRRIMGLYLYATGAQRQTITVLAHLGISESYQNLTHKPRTNARRRRRRVLGDYCPPTPPPTPSISAAEAYVLPDAVVLSNEIEDLLAIKLSTLHELSSRTRRRTALALWKARLEDMQIPDLNASFNTAPPLSLKDIFLITPDKIELHQTVLHPTPAWNIDQSTIIPNAEVADAIYNELEVKGLAHWKWAVKILAGDQLSIARLRSLVNIRAGHEGGTLASVGVLECRASSMAKLRTCMSTLDECAASIETYAQLELLAGAIQTNVQRLKPRTESYLLGDQTFENSCLLLLDALVSREFTDSIKAGDSGRIVLVLKLLALSFRGNGRSNNIILNNWLVNPTGHPFSWVETIYQAHGSAASWEWLAMVAPCVTALRHLSTSITRILGSDQGTKHEPADPSTDIKLLMKSLAEHDVYKIKGRVFAEVEYNAAFRKLQARLRLRPLVDSWSEDPPAATEDPASRAPSAPPAGVDVELPVDIHRPQAELDGSEEADSDVDGDSVDGDGNVERTMDEADEPTLTRDSAADVALDMDGDDDDFLFSGNIYDDEDTNSEYYYVDDVDDLDYVED